MSQTFHGQGTAFSFVREREQLNGMFFVAASEFHFCFKRLEVAGILWIFEVCDRLGFFKYVCGLRYAPGTCVLGAQPETRADLSARRRQEGKSKIQFSKLRGTVALTIRNNGEQVVLAQDAQGPFEIFIGEKSLLQSWLSGGVLSVIEIEPSQRAQASRF